MTLTDTGPLLALLDKRDPHHAACLTMMQRLTPGALLTTWPCFTEAMYLLGEVGGFRYQSLLWDMLESGKLEIQDLGPAEVGRMAILMGKYQDTPMDLADASIVATAEMRGIHRVFTLDGDFRIYRLADGTALEVVP
mgnify:CR=1 FL=1